jgi:hypothetical protein
MKTLKIFIIDNGFIYIGYGERYTDELLGDCLIIRTAHNVRRWGTTKNIGQLAVEGKQSETVLDYTGAVTAPIQRVIHTIEITKQAAKTYGF